MGVCMRVRGEWGSGRAWHAPRAVAIEEQSVTRTSKGRGECGRAARTPRHAATYKANHITGLAGFLRGALLLLLYPLPLPHGASESKRPIVAAVVVAAGWAGGGVAQEGCWPLSSPRLLALCTEALAP